MPHCGSVLTIGASTPGVPMTIGPLARGPMTVGSAVRGSSSVAGPGSRRVFQSSIRLGPEELFALCDV